MLRQSCSSTARYRSSPVPLPLRLLCFRLLLPALRGFSSWCIFIAPAQETPIQRHKHASAAANPRNDNFEAGRRTVRAPFPALFAVLSMIKALLSCFGPALLPEPGQAQRLVQRPAYARYCQLLHRGSVSQRRTSCSWRHVQHAIFRSHQTKRHGFARLGIGASEFRAYWNAHGRSESADTWSCCTQKRGRVTNCPYFG